MRKKDTDQTTLQIYVELLLQKSKKHGKRWKCIIRWIYWSCRYEMEVWNCVTPPDRVLQAFLCLHLLRTLWPNPRFGSLGLEGEKVWEYYASSGQLLYFPLFSAFSSPELSPWEGEAAGPPSSQPESLLLPSTRTQHQNLIGGRKFLKRSTPIHSAGREIVSGIQTSGRGRRTLCGSQGPRARS